MYPKSYLLRADKQALRQSFCKPFWYRKNARVNSQKVLLVNATKGLSSLRQELQYLLDFQDSLS